MKNFQEFKIALENDDELFKTMSAAQTDEQLVFAARQAGYEITAEQLVSASAEKSGELDDDALSSVGGGLGVGGGNVGTIIAKLIFGKKKSVKQKKTSGISASTLEFNPARDDSAIQTMQVSGIDDKIENI